MIVSPKYKYIFIKPRKVAGSSIEIVLAKYLSPAGVIPPITAYTNHHDRDKYILRPQNYTEYYDHLLPGRIRKKVGGKIWRQYFKFTVIRNPWDMVVSAYWWEKNKKIKLSDYFQVINIEALLDYLKDYKKITRPRNFSSFVRRLPNSYVYTPYYFYSNGKPIENYYIRYENLDEDFEKVCHKLGIPHQKPPRLKSRTRKNKKHYSKYYNKETKEIVEKIFKKEIQYFNYRF